MWWRLHLLYFVCGFFDHLQLAQASEMLFERIDNMHTICIERSVPFTCDLGFFFYFCIVTCVQLQHFEYSDTSGACRVILLFSFRNPPNSETDYQIFNVYM